MTCIGVSPLRLIDDFPRPYRAPEQGASRRRTGLACSSAPSDWLLLQGISSEEQPFPIPTCSACKPCFCSESAGAEQSSSIACKPCFRSRFTGGSGAQKQRTITTSFCSRYVLIIISMLNLNPSRRRADFFHSRGPSDLRHSPVRKFGRDAGPGLLILGHIGYTYAITYI
jgi:hypothetical protein